MHPAHWEEERCHLDERVISKSVVSSGAESSCCSPTRAAYTAYSNYQVNLCDIVTWTVKSKVCTGVSVTFVITI
jgi:hypothetical protein